MPRYQPVFVNMLNGNPVPKYGPGFIVEQAFNPNLLPPTAEYIDMDESGVMTLATPALWTDSVATCHAICMYGYTNQHLTHMGMCHASLGIYDEIVDLVNELADEGCDRIFTYVIGGQPNSTSAYVPRVLDFDFLINFSIQAVISPLTTNDGGAATVLMAPNFIKFFIEDDG